MRKHIIILVVLGALALLLGFEFVQVAPASGASAEADYCACWTNVYATVNGELVWVGQVCADSCDPEPYPAPEQQQPPPDLYPAPAPITSRAAQIKTHKTCIVVPWLVDGEWKKREWCYSNR